MKGSKPSFVARRARLQLAMLIESDVDSRVGRSRKLTQSLELLQTHQRRVRLVGFGRLLALAQGVDFRFSLDANRFRRDLSGQFRGRGLSLGFRAMRVGVDLRVNALRLRLRASLD